MTGVDIAAHASEAGGANPLPTGAVETGENLSPGSAGSFHEALAAQRALTLAERLAADRSSGNRVGGRQVQIVNRVGQDRGFVQSGV